MTVSAIHSLTDTAAAKLVRLLDGEYTASSVISDPADAIRLGLFKAADGNYGTPPPPPSAGARSARSSPTVLAKLGSLKLGGL